MAAHLIYATGAVVLAHLVFAHVAITLDAQEHSLALSAVVVLAVKRLPPVALKTKSRLPGFKPVFFNVVDSRLLAVPRRLGKHIDCVYSISIAFFKDSTQSWSIAKKLPILVAVAGKWALRLKWGYR